MGNLKQIWILPSMFDSNIKTCIFQWSIWVPGQLVINQIVIWTFLCKRYSTFLPNCQFMHKIDFYVKKSRKFSLECIRVKPGCNLSSSYLKFLRTKFNSYDIFSLKDYLKEFWSWVHLGVRPVGDLSKSYLKFLHKASTFPLVWLTQYSPTKPTQ